MKAEVARKFRDLCKVRRAARDRDGRDHERDNRRRNADEAGPQSCNSDGRLVATASGRLPANHFTSTSMRIHGWIQH